MVVLRAHDTWDNWPEIGIRDSWARGLGLTNFIAQDSTRWHAVYEIEETTLEEFALYVARRVGALGEDSVRVMGDPQMRVSRPSLGVGCGGPDTDMIELGSDVLIVCYDGASYWAKRERFLEHGAGVIVVEHGTSEMWGIENLAHHLAETFPKLDVHYLDRHPRPWTVMRDEPGQVHPSVREAPRYLALARQQGWPVKAAQERAMAASEGTAKPKARRACATRPSGSPITLA